jgi:hypothetical protein
MNALPARLVFCLGSSMFACDFLFCRAHFRWLVVRFTDFLREMHRLDVRLQLFFFNATEVSFGLLDVRLCVFFCRPPLAVWARGVTHRFYFDECTANQCDQDKDALLDSSPSDCVLFHRNLFVCDFGVRRGSLIR